MTSQTAADADTPLMRQYHRIKADYQDAILCFRLGDFYEMFFEDARVTARVLEVTLTSKPVGKDTEVPMAGIPVHSAHSYLDKLIDAGHRVAICEQVEDADASSGVVEREVVRVLTPGTLTEEDYLESRRNNYLMSLIVTDEDPRGGGGRRAGLAYVDLSTGEFEVTQFRDGPDVDVLGSEVNRLYPSEVLIPDDDEHEALLGDLLEYRENVAVVRRPNGHYESEEAARQLRQQFPDDDSVDGEDGSLALRAAGGLLAYLEETQKRTLKHLDRLSTYERDEFMVLDATSQRNLELVESLTGQTRATLLNVLDETETAMGGRRLRHWILQPLMNERRIENHLDAVEWLTEHGEAVEALREELRRVYDIERIVGKIGSNRANPLDLGSLSESLERVPALRERLPERGLLERLRGQLDPMDDLRRELREGLVEDPPTKLGEGGIFRDGYHEELDELREAMRDGKDWIARLQETERERTGIDSLKVGHNKVHGYYIEVTKANLDAVPEDYERRQTLTNSERYVTPELKEKERVIFGAEEKSEALEEELFRDLRERLTEQLARLKRNADALARLDVLTSLADVARRRNYVRPSLGDGLEIELRESRHPVVEVIHEEEFVPNDLTLDEDRRLVILTGPNMAGKSTYIRQVALITIMAQMGSFVPADRARIGLVDQVFTRVGAHDFLAGGKSTFMVEMSETADIVNNATERSLLILDEIGRGTSTYDGMAIARSVVEYLAERVGARTLFATHYHELTTLADRYDTVVNLTVRAREWEDDIVFLRQVEEGVSDRSYGVQVARLAGLPPEVIDRARELLQELEDNRARRSGGGSDGDGAEQLDLFHPARQVASRLSSIELEDLTPLEAMNVLAQMQSTLQDETEAGGAEDE